MPIFDVRCACGWSREDVFEQHRQPTVCPTCGAATEHVWTARTAAIHGDDKFIGGLTLENLGHTPVTVHSRSELKRALAERGLQPFVRHQPDQGSDKSKETTRWV